MSWFFFLLQVKKEYFYNVIVHFQVNKEPLYKLKILINDTSKISILIDEE